MVALREGYLEADLAECMEKVRNVFRDLDRASWEIYLNEWQGIKMGIAEALADCILAIIGSKRLKGIYFVDLSGGEANIGTIGRDVDLLILLDENTQGEREEVEKTIEAVANKIIRILGIEFSKYTSAPDIVEVHVIRDPNKDPYGQLLRSYYTPPIPIWVKE